MYSCRKTLMLIFIIALVKLINCGNDSYELMSFGHDASKNDIEVSILGKKTIYIKKDRFLDDDDIYGTGQLDNRFTLDEMDSILNAIKGKWKLGEYIGYVDYTLYYPDLFDCRDSLEQSVQNDIIKKYKQKVNIAKSSIPKIDISIKQCKNKNVYNNYIIVNDNYLSPISIIISLDRITDNYPVFVDRTTISTDFFVKYPVIYIKFFIESIESESGVKKYEPATLVLTNDSKFYILIDGAFYSVVKA